MKEKKILHMCSSELSISMPLDDMLSLCFQVGDFFGSIVLSIFFRLALRVWRFFLTHFSGVTDNELNEIELEDVVLVASDEFDEECDEL